MWHTFSIMSYFGRRLHNEDRTVDVMGAVVANATEQCPARSSLIIKYTESRSWKNIYNYCFFLFIILFFFFSTSDLIPVCICIPFNSAEATAADDDEINVQFLGCLTDLILWITLENQGFCLHLWNYWHWRRKDVYRYLTIIEINDLLFMLEIY